jgi:hypothetical protein
MRGKPCLCGPCAVKEDCIPSGPEQFGFTSFLAPSPSAYSVLDTGVPLVLDVVRTPQFKLPQNGGRYDCDGNFVLQVGERCRYRAFLGLKDDHILNGVHVFTTNGRRYFMDTHFARLVEEAYPGGSFPWKSLGGWGSWWHAVAANGDWLFAAFASDENGGDYGTTPDIAKQFIAIVRLAPNSPAPSQSDFDGLWEQYHDSYNAAEEVADGEMFVAKTTHIVFRAKAGVIPSPCNYLDIQHYPPPVDGFLAPPDFGTHSATVDLAVERDECGCPHMIPSHAETLSFAAHEWRKRVTLNVIAHDPPQYWGCEGGGYAGGLESGYEAALAVLSNLVPDDFDAVLISPTAALNVICDHAPGPPLDFQIAVKEIDALFTGAGGFRSFKQACENPLGSGYFMGLWDAGANRPRLENGGILYFNNENQAGLPWQAPAGCFMRVAGVGDNYTLDGESGWAVGDIVYSDGLSWSKQAGSFREEGKFLMDSWRKIDSGGFHLDPQELNQGNLVNVTDAYVVDYWQKSYGREKDGGANTGYGLVSPQCVFAPDSPGVTGATNDTSYNWTYTDPNPAVGVYQQSAGTLSEKNSDAEDIAIADALLALGDFSDPAKYGGVFGIQPGAAAADPDTDAMFADYFALPLGVGNVNLGILNNWQGSGNSAASARARWIDAEGRKSYALRRREFTVSWNNAQKPYVLTHVYLGVSYQRHGDSTAVGGYMVELSNGVPHVVEPPPEWGCVAFIGFSSESEFVCHPGQPLPP